MNKKNLPMNPRQLLFSYNAALYWDVTKACNFDCPQCAGSRIKLSAVSVPPTINLPALQRFLDNAGGKCFKFNFTGGEPLLVENILEVLLEISKNHYVGLISNLVSPKVPFLAEILDPKRVTYINASFHLIELERKGLLKTFLDHLVILKNKGFYLTISEVAYPYIIDKIDYYQEILKPLGLKVEFNAFRGVWKKKKYPAAYTQEEIDRFDLANKPEFRPDIFKHKGQLCNAGYNSVIILENGDVYPCYFQTKHNQKLGNIYTGFKFKEKLVKCPARICTCPFPAFETRLYDDALKQLKENKVKPLIKRYSERLFWFFRKAE